MNEISEYVLDLYNQLSEGESQPIDDSIVDDAISVINNLTETSSNSLFYLLSAINLLNAAIKIEKNKSQLFYGFIKTRVSKVADNVLKNPSSFTETSVYYDVTQKCIYFNVYDVIFSFHQIQETKLIKNIASKNKPIIWQGIRLQRIAQKIYLYAKQITNMPINTNSKDSSIIEKEPARTESRLVSCPDCSSLISLSAQFCPHCGSTLEVSEQLLNGIKEGYSIKITYNGFSSSGKIEAINHRYITLLVQDDKWIRVRNSVLDSVELLDTNEISTELFAQQSDLFFTHIFDIAGVNKSSLIPTNSTITDVNKTGLTLITDSGNKAFCAIPNIVGFKRKECTIGKRLYSNVTAKGKCYNSIVEMTYESLITIFQKIIAQNKNISYARKSQSLSILTYLGKEMSSNPEVFVELKNFKKKVKIFLGQLNEECDSFSELGMFPSTNDNIIDNDDKIDSEINDSEFYKTDTEKQLETIGVPKIKIVGKIDLDKITGVKNKGQDIIEKPSIITSKTTTDFINRKLTNLSDSRCKIIEKELDTLIRNGEKEKCLIRSYEIINTSRPTSKYMKSYLDRIVNTEIALDHTEAALQALAYLIAFTEQQGDTNSNSMGHLYVTMSRLYLKEKNKEEALKAIHCAESLKPQNNAIIKLKESIMQLELNNESSNISERTLDKAKASNNSTKDEISRMLIQDVKKEAHRLEILPNNESIPADVLFGKAQKQRNDDSETYEDRGLLFLEAAAAYYNNKQTDTNMFKISVANYARLRGHGMFVRFSNLIENNDLNIQALQTFRDSACSYYVESLGIFNLLGEYNYLRELLLKYLQLSFIISQIKGEKTPEHGWENIPLGKLQEICLKGDSAENLNVLLDTYLAIGSTAESAWVSLLNDKGGIGPFRGKCETEQKFKALAFSVLNRINKSNIEESLDLEDFMHKVFENRQVRICSFKKICQICLDWEFSTFDIPTFESRWSQVTNYKELMTTTDQAIVDNIAEIIEILKPYAGRKENERTRLLVRSQQILLSSQKIVTDTTTFYGKTFFSHLVSEWLTEISRLLEERDAGTYPKLEITPEPCYIRTNEEGCGVINFVVTNNGDSTAQSFFVSITINGKKYKITHDKELPAGDCCGESLTSEDFIDKESFNVVFELTAKYQGKELPSINTEATYEVESGDILTDEIDIPWTTSNIPEEHIFKGREDVLNTLIEHYLSKGRSLTYILYGLTRTGKSSILDYLRSRINGRTIKESPDKKILPFKWDLSAFPYKNSTSAQFWTWALESNIYNELPDDLADHIDFIYGEKGLPPAEQLSQLDFTKIVNALNNQNIIPLITIDEFSFVRQMLNEGLIDATFIATLRNLALTGKSCFVYAGTYEIKDLPKEKEFGLQGQMTNTRSMHINEIAPQYADELIDACELITFDDKAKAYIRALSGCVPYWIQWICHDCGKYAVAHKRKHLGYNEVDYVVNILTGERQPSKFDTCVAIDETNFNNNQIDPENTAEHQLISSISYLTRESTQIERGISMDELKRIWDKYSVNEEKRVNMTKALASLMDKKIIRSFTDEGREVYRLNVDLFRRWWFIKHRDLDRVFGSTIK